MKYRVLSVYTCLRRLYREYKVRELSWRVMLLIDNIFHYLKTNNILRYFIAELQNYLYIYMDTGLTMNSEFL